MRPIANLTAMVVAVFAVGCASRAPPYPARRPLADLSAHSNTVESLAFSPDGRILVTGGGDKNLISWDARTGRQLSSAQSHQRSWSVHSLVFNPAGDVLASAGDDNQVILWEANTLVQIRVLDPPPQGQQIRGIRFANDGRKLLGAVMRGSTGQYFEGCLVAWDVATGNCSVLDESAACYPNIIELLQDCLITLWSDGRVTRRRLEIDRKSGLVSLGPASTLAEQASTHSGSMAASADKGILAVAKQGGTVVVIDVGTAQVIAALPPEPKTDGGVDCLAFSKDGSLLLSAHGMAPPHFTVLRAWRGPGYSGCDVFSTPDTVGCAAFSPDGKVFATGDGTGRAKLWEAGRLPDE
jgi:WD40 repeat protein